MLILSFVDNPENRRVRFFKKRNVVNNQVLKRNSINVNGKNVIILELTKKDLNREDVSTLLKIYKGRVLVSEEFKNEEMIKDYLYNSKEYYQRAVLSSLVNQIKTVSSGWNSFAIKIEDFFPFKEFYEIVRISKKVTILTQINAYTDKFLRECYYRYGAIVSIKNENLIDFNGAFIDLDTVDDKGKIIITVEAKDFVLYPDTKYFEYCSEYQKLLPYNISNNIICSAFSNK